MNTNYIRETFQRVMLFIQENWKVLSPQQKQIVRIASYIFSAITATYIIYQGAKILSNRSKKVEPIKPPKKEETLEAEQIGLASLVKLEDSILKPIVVPPKSIKKVEEKKPDPTPPKKDPEPKIEEIPFSPAPVVLETSPPHSPIQRRTSIVEPPPPLTRGLSFNRTPRQSVSEPNSALIIARAISPKTKAVSPVTAPVVTVEPPAYTKVDHPGKIVPCFSSNGKTLNGVHAFTFLDIKYQGTFSDGFLINGKMDTDDISLEGSFSDGNFYQGKFILKDKDKQTIFDGIFEKNKLKTGTLTVNEAEETSVSVGEFKNNVLEGQGKLTEIDKEGLKTVWEGTFENGYLVNGTMFISAPKTGEEESLAGNFKKGRLTGKGGILITKSATYEGEFVDGDLSGEGKITYNKENGKEIHEGTFIENRLNGEGTITFADGIVHKGNFLKGKLNGKGEKAIPEAGSDNSYLTMEKGTFKNDALDGPDCLWVTNKGVLEGFFVEGDLTGKGKITYHKAAGKTEIHEGNFENNVLNGEGSITFPDGKVYKGKFLKGKLHESGEKTEFSKAPRPNAKEATPCTIKSEGIFSNGKLIKGTITFTWKDGEKTLDTKTYEGKFGGKEFYHLDGKGKKKVNGKVTEDGFFKNGNFYKGKKYFQEKAWDEGDFKNGLLNGKGKRFVDRKLIESGTFINGKLEGNGERDGKKGNFKDGNLIPVEGTLVLSLHRAGSNPPLPPIQKDLFLSAISENAPTDNSEGISRENKPDLPTYAGFLKNGALLNGKQEIKWNGSEINGTFVEGVLTEGIIIDSEKKKFEGKLENGEIKQGTLTLPNGTVLKGIFINKLLHGDGCERIYQNDGSKIIEKGGFAVGNLTKGSKKVIDKEGVETIYEGDFHKGFLITGEIAGKDISLSGIFQNNLLHGPDGVCLNSKSGVKLEGEFEEGKLKGKGKVTFFSKTPEEVHEGNFLNNELCGKGKKLINGEVFEEGTFEEGLLHGYGKRNGEDPFEGEFANGKPVEVSSGTMAVDKSKPAGKVGAVIELS